MNNFNSKGTILFVDDEQVVLDVSTLMLYSLRYNVLPATIGMEANQIFRDNANEICFAILDMRLPDEDGSDTCKRLKEIKPDLKVLHTSGLGATLSDKSMECGCKGLLPKPFKNEALSNNLIELLESAK